MGSEWSASRPGRALAPWKGPPVPTVQKAWWAPEPVWTQRLQEKSFRLCRGSNLDRSAVYIDKCRYEIQEQNKFRYDIPTYTGPFRTVVMRVLKEGSNLF
jgi:hypothetical protein